MMFPELTANSQSPGRPQQLQTTKRGRMFAGGCRVGNIEKLLHPRIHEIPVPHSSPWHLTNGQST